MDKYTTDIDHYRAHKITIYDTARPGKALNSSGPSGDGLKLSDGLSGDGLKLSDGLFRRP